MSTKTPKSVGQIESRDSIGLEDGGHVILKCSNCDAPLINLWITTPNLETEMPVQADCPHCGDHSFKQTINGGFHIGSTDYTVHIDSETLDDRVLFKTHKGSKEWKR